jgi:hypothetical protein
LGQSAKSEPGSEADEEQSEGALEANPYGKQRCKWPEDAKAEHRHGRQDADPGPAQAKALLNLGHHGRSRREGRAQVDRGSHDAGHSEKGHKRSAPRTVTQPLRFLRPLIKSTEHTSPL